MTVTAVLLAGGASSRMGGRDKLLEVVDGTPLIRRQALACLSASIDQVRVVIPPDRPERVEALIGLDVDVVLNHGSELGMSHSLQVGIQDVKTNAALIVLADLPELTASDLGRVISAANAHPLAKVLRGASLKGKPGHPVLFRKELYDLFAELSGDTGAQPLLNAHAADTVLVPIGPAATRDLDTPEDWAMWRSSRT